MQDLKTLEKRIDNLRKTRKMTDSMRMIATLEIRRLQNMVSQSRLIDEQLEQFRQAMQRADIDGLQQGFPGIAADGRAGRILLLLISSERGLAGGFQASLLRCLRSQMNVWSGQVDVISLGESAASSIGEDARLREVAVLPYAERPEDTDAVRLVQQVMCQLQCQAYDSIRVIAERYRKAGVQQAECFSLWPPEEPSISAAHVTAGTPDNTPIAESAAVQQLSAVTDIPDCEPGIAELMIAWNEFYLRRKLLMILRESRTSEVTQRMMAMTAATDNADDMINRLERERRKSRQAKITQEMLELTGDME